MNRPASRQREKAQVLDDQALDRALTRIAHEILERTTAPATWHSSASVRAA